MENDDGGYEDVEDEEPQAQDVGATVTDAVTVAAKKKKHSATVLRNQLKQLVETGSEEEVREWLFGGLQTAEMANWKYDEDEALKRIWQIVADAEIKALDVKSHPWQIPKLHLLQHFAITIEKFGYLQQYSSEIGETLHKGVKEAYRHSNRKNTTQQILHFHTRKWAVRMREINLEQLAKDGQFQEEITEALSLYATKKHRLLAAKLNRAGDGSLSDYYARLERHNAKHAVEEVDVEKAKDPTEDRWFIPAPVTLKGAVVDKALAEGRAFKSEPKFLNSLIFPTQSNSFLVMSFRSKTPI
ncbi:hypothetical protein BJ508DRAFT_337095 [Ascobolus immersus RN42]|uniref:Uncharacterized protein n=1 Tax=Ascobolus immersus RN42 TaxID=1160509 RepID=A0A3N4H6B6_ASCIM|nr:hypothetical protein BJ508DRAFT_337095 [Ascobolus immersus RN42]